jgi:hypothetical protein
MRLNSATTAETNVDVRTILARIANDFIIVCLAPNGHCLDNITHHQFTVLWYLYFGCPIVLLGHVWDMNGEWMSADLRMSSDPCRYSFNMSRIKEKLVIAVVTNSIRSSLIT